MLHTPRASSRCPSRATSNNVIDVLVDPILTLQTLEELDVSSNVIYSLSDDIGNLVNLRKLYVNSNKLVALPQSIK